MAISISRLVLLFEVDITSSSSDGAHDVTAEFGSDGAHPRDSACGHCNIPSRGTSLWSDVGGAAASALFILVGEDW